jgi:hypothetical protein
MEHPMAGPGQAPANLPNAGHFYTNLAKPIDINLNFIVDSTNGNGLGVRSVKSNGYVAAVFMHTSASPGTVNGLLNPNPAVGLIIVQLKGNFNRYIGGFSGIAAPLTSTSTTSTTSGNAYVITSLGTTTLAQWQAAGVPKGQTPSVGMAFVAIATGAIGGTGTVGVPALSPIQPLQLVGDPNQSISNSNSAANGGAYLILQAPAATNSSTTTLALTAPADSSVIGMTIRLDGSSVNVDGL